MKINNRQVEMTGSSVFDYVHHADHVEIAEQLGLSLSNQNSMPSPSSGHSDDTHGTNNPDGKLESFIFFFGTFFSHSRTFTSLELKSRRHSRARFPTMLHRMPPRSSSADDSSSRSQRVTRGNIEPNKYTWSARPYTDHAKRNYWPTRSNEI